MNTASTLPSAHAGLLPIASLERSPTNPRTHFDPEKIKQLGETIRSQGFLQKLLVRPWPGRAGVFEIVDGERRYRAAKAIGEGMLPVDVRELSDAQVIEIQLVAGDTGEPLSPLEEAAGFQTALKLKDPKSGAPCFTYRSLGEKLGCGKSHIEQRLDLLRLPASVREHVASGSLAARTANLLARIPEPKAMEAAIQDVLFPKHREDPLPYREAEAWIHERYMMSLKGAPFDVTDATLTGPEGKPLACAACPLKSGNSPEKFGDVKDKNTCTSPGCFRAKCNAAWDRAAAKAKAAGQRVLTAEETEDVFEKNSPTVQIAFSSPYVDVDSQPTYRHVANEVEDKKLPTWRELLETAAEKKKIKVPTVLARDRTGKQWELVQLTLAIEAAKAIGEDFFKKTAVADSINSKDRFDRDAVRSAVRGSDDFAEKKKAEADATKKRTVESCLAIVKLHDALSLKITGNEAITDALLPTALHHAGNDGQALFTKAFSLQTGGGDFEHSDAIASWFKKKSKSDRHAAIPVLLIAHSLRWNGLKCEGFTALAESVKLDVAAIEKEAALSLGKKADAEKGRRGDRETAAAPAATSAAVRPKGRELGAGELKEFAEKWFGKPAKDIAFRFGISVGLAKWYDSRVGSPVPPADVAAVTNFGLTEGKYIAVKTLLTAGKPLAVIASQLGITLGQVEGVASREKSGKRKGAKGAKGEPGKVAEGLVRGSVKIRAPNGGFKYVKTHQKGGAK